MTTALSGAIPSPVNPPPADDELDTVADPKQPDVKLTLREGDVLDAGDLLPGFTLPVRDIFAVLDQQAPS